VRFSALAQTGPGECFWGVKWLGLGVDHPATEVKEGAELNFTLPLPGQL